MSKNILIIGINGFLGKHLSKTLFNNGMNVFGTSHSKSTDKNIYQLSVGEDISKLNIYKDDYDAVIYLTHIYNKDKANELFIWYQRLYNYFRGKTKKQIYISSYSAHKNATSNYGKTKYKIEQFFVKNNCISVNPGLIIGDGGIFLKIKKLVKIMPVVFMPVNKESNLVPIIKIKLLSELLYQIVYQKNNNILKYNLFSSMTSLKSLIKSINNKKIVIEINATLILKILRFMERLHIKLPITSDSLSGFIANQELNTKSNIGKIK